MQKMGHESRFSTASYFKEQTQSRKMPPFFGTMKVVEAHFNSGGSAMLFTDNILLLSILSLRVFGPAQ